MKTLIFQVPGKPNNGRHDQTKPVKGEQINGFGEGERKKRRLIDVEEEEGRGGGEEIEK